MLSTMWLKNKLPKEFLDTCEKSRTARRCLDICERFGIGIEFFDGTGGFSNPITRTIRLGRCNSNWETIVGHFCCHVPNILKRQRVVPSEEVKQMILTDPVKFVDYQTACALWNLIASCKLRNTYLREIGGKEISLDKEVFSPIWGGFKSQIHYCRYNYSKFLEQLEAVPKDSNLLIH